MAVLAVAAVSVFLKLWPRWRPAAPTAWPVARWQQVITDGAVFLLKWGAQAEALGWSDADLFGLPPVPEQPHPSFTRLARYDLTGLCWKSAPDFQMISIIGGEVDGPALR